MKQVFIQTDISFSVFIVFPDGCCDKGVGRVKAIKSEYGLKQVGRCWIFRLGDVFVSKVGVEQ